MVEPGPPPHVLRAPVRQCPATVKSKTMLYRGQENGKLLHSCQRDNGKLLQLRIMGFIRPERILMLPVRKSSYRELRLQ